MKKMVAGFLMMIMLICCLAGCGDTEGKQDDKADGVKESEEKITVWLAGTGENLTDQAYRKCFDNYCAKNAGVSYELSFISWADYFTKLNSALASGAGPDIYMLGYGQIGSVLALDYIQNLGEYIPEEWDGYTEIPSKFLDAGRKDGDIYAMFTPSTRVWIYRTDIAKQQGVTEEDLHISTPEEFYNLVRKLTVRDENGAVTMPGLQFDQDQEQFFYVLASMYQDEPMRLWDEDMKATFNTEAAVKSIEDMKKLAEEGCVVFSGPAEVADGVSSGVAAMTLTAEDLIPSAEAAQPGKVGVVRSDMNTAMIGSYIVVSSQSQHKETASAMLLDLYSEESRSIMAKELGAYSGREALDEEYISLNPEYEKVVETYQWSNTYSPVFNPKYNELIAEFRLGLERIYGGADAKEELDKMAEAWDAKSGQ